LLAPFAMCTPFAYSDYYGASAPSHGPRSATDLPFRADWMPGIGATADGSHVHLIPISQGGAQLYSGSFTTTTPQAFTVAS